MIYTNPNPNLNPNPNPTTVLGMMTIHEQMNYLFKLRELRHRGYSLAEGIGRFTMMRYMMYTNPNPNPNCDYECLGKVMWEQSWEEAAEVGTTINEFYDNIFNRSREIYESIEREQITIDVAQSLGIDANVQGNSHDDSRVADESTAGNHANTNINTNTQSDNLGILPFGADGVAGGNSLDSIASDNTTAIHESMVNSVASGLEKSLTLTPPSLTPKMNEKASKADGYSSDDSVDSNIDITTGLPKNLLPHERPKDLDSKNDDIATLAMSHVSENDFGNLNSTTSSSVISKVSYHSATDRLKDFDARDILGAETSGSYTESTRDDPTLSLASYTQSDVLDDVDDIKRSKDKNDNNVHHIIETDLETNQKHMREALIEEVKKLEDEQKRKDEEKRGLEERLLKMQGSYDRYV